mmetsp:Transcript_44490/g.108557  ORF Transcript_44490/g.108557 Transcript_44490/m.108557 type:complete len:209 (-) Transcript_44490:1388-2014(-)
MLPSSSTTGTLSVASRAAALSGSSSCDGSSCPSTTLVASLTANTLQSHAACLPAAAVFLPPAAAIDCLSTESETKGMIVSRSTGERRSGAWRAASERAARTDGREVKSRERDSKHESTTDRISSHPSPPSAIRVRAAYFATFQFSLEHRSLRRRSTGLRARRASRQSEAVDTAFRRGTATDWSSARLTSRDSRSLDCSQKRRELVCAR